MRRAAVELRDLGETLLVIVATWLLLGWFFDRAITQADGTVFVVPFTKSALAGGFDWTHHLYRFGVLGGSSMHDFNGTLPLVQLCGLLGLSTTLTVNLVTVFVQLCFGFFGLVAVRALVTTWGGARAPSLPQRIACIWLVGFAPVLAWRLAYGHEILLLGLLPLVVGLALLWASRAGTLGGVALAAGAVAVWHAVACLGQQTLIYSIVFGGPILIATLLDAPRGARWGRAQWRVLLALAAGVLVALPGLAGMIAYAAGDDASRSLSTSLVYSYPSPAATDWLASLTWSGQLAGDGAAQERNFPLGPLVVLAVVLWPRGRSRALLWALAGGGALAILFAADVPPVSTVLLHVPLVESFRVPARAVMPVLVLVPILAVAAWFAWPGVRDAAATRRWWFAVLAAVGIIVVGGRVPALVREPVAWLACGALAWLARRRPAQLARAAPGLALVAALGVVAFGERFPREAPYDPVEAGPAALHDALIARAPELAMPLARVQIVDAPPPYEMSTAFAAGLASLDGDMIPPRRFFALLAALGGRPVPPTTVVWKLTRTRAFPVLQQLYNVRYVVALPSAAGTGGAITETPATPGPAWFPAQLEVVPDAAAMAAALAARAGDLRGALLATGWLVRGDPGIPAATRCTGARVGEVTTDALGQAATIATDAPAAGCVLVVATNYVATLRATAGDTALPVFPIDVALTGIAVPPGRATIVLAPEAVLPLWARLASVLGLLALVGALVPPRA